MAKNSAPIEAKILALTATVAEVHALHSQKSLDLVGNPDDEGLQMELQALEDEIAAHSRSIARLRAASEQAKLNDSKEARLARYKTLQADRHQIDKLGAELSELASRIVSHVEGLGPLLAQFESLSSDRRALASSTMRNDPTPGDHLRSWHTLQPAIALRTGPVAAAVAAALWRAGLGRVGVDLSPWTQVGAPSWDGPFARGDIHSVMQEQIAKSQARLHSVLDRSVEAAK